MKRSALIPLAAIFLSLTACRPAVTRSPILSTLPVVPLATSAMPTVTPAQPEPAPTLSRSAPHPALQAAQEYAAALQAGDVERTEDMISAFSLTAAETTRSETASRLLSSPARWSDFSTGETRAVDTTTVLVQVRYQVEDKPVEEWWAMRLEGDTWRFNYGGLVDFVTLNLDAQTTAGLTIKPLRLERTTTGIKLIFLAQNRTNETIILGQANEIMAAFLFDGEQIEAEKVVLVFEPLRSYPEVTIEINGLFASYPDGVIIRQWKNYDVKPWFSFSFVP